MKIHFAGIINSGDFEYKKTDVRFRIIGEVWFLPLAFSPILHDNTAEVDIHIFMTHSLMNAISFQ